MSITQKAPKPADAAPGDGSPTSPAVPVRRSWSPRTLGIAAGLTALVIGSVVIARTSGSTPASSTGGKSKAASVAPGSSAPITLPGHIAGLNPLSPISDPTKVKNWLNKATQAAHGTAFAAQGYGTPGTHRTMRLVAARTDLSGTLEMIWAADAGHAVGADHCTQNVRLVPQGQARVRPTIMLCWRTSATLSAYVLVIDPRATLTDADAAPALDQVWSAIPQQ